MPKIDPDRASAQVGSELPHLDAALMAGRTQWALGDAAGLTQFGVSLVRLEPGSVSSLRHWHEKQDEFLVVLEGELTLMEDEGATLMRPGDCAGFPAGVPNGHHLVNRSERPARFLVVGTRTDEETGHYSDLDLVATFRNGAVRFTRRDGTPYDDPSDSQGGRR